LSSNLQDAWIGSATVTAQSGKQIAVVANVFAGADGMQTTNAFPVESIGTTWAVPQFASKLTNGFSTTINLQNVTSTEIATGTITLECNPEPGSGSVGTVSKVNLSKVPGNAAYAFNPIDVAQGFPSNWQGACIVNAPQNIVVFNQLRRPGVTGDISAYECFLTSSTNSLVVVPLVAKRLTNGFASGITIMNLDTVNTAYVTVTFTRSPESSVGSLTYTKDYTIGPRLNQQINMRLPAQPDGLGMPDNWQGSAVVKTTSGHVAVPLIAYVQLTNIQTLPGDNWMSHQAFILPETP
jgi:hypothetical protein